MLNTRQIVILSGVAALFWAAATTWIHFVPGSLRGTQGDVGFLISIPACWLCILGVRRVAGLAREQLVAGTALVVALATMIDASALRWAHSLYSASDTVCRFGAAWLLWGYGGSLGIALLIQRARQSDETRGLLRRSG